MIGNDIASKLNPVGILIPFTSPSLDSRVTGSTFSIMKCMIIERSSPFKKHIAYFLVSHGQTDTNQLLVNIRSSLRSCHNYSKQLLAAISGDLLR